MKILKNNSLNRKALANSQENLGKSLKKSLFCILKSQILTNKSPHKVQNNRKVSKEKKRILKITRKQIQGIQGKGSANLKEKTNQLMNLTNRKEQRDKIDLQEENKKKTKLKWLKKKEKEKRNKNKRKTRLRLKGLENSSRKRQF